MKRIRTTATDFLPILTKLRTKGRHGHLHRCLGHCAATSAIYLLSDTLLIITLWASLS